MLDAPRLLGRAFHWQPVLSLGEAESKIWHSLPFGYPSLDDHLWVLVVLVAVVVLFAPKVDLELGILYLLCFFPLLYYLHSLVNQQWILYHENRFSDRL